MPTQSSLKHIGFSQARKTQLGKLQDCQAVIAACVLPVDFTPLVEGLSNGEHEEVDTVVDEIMAVSRSAAERLASDAEAGAVLFEICRLLKHCPQSHPSVSSCSSQHC